MRVVNLLFGHLLDHFLLGNRRVGVSSDGAERVPHIGAGQVDGCADALFIVPADAGLRAGMALHGAAEIPFKGADGVFFDAEAERVHDADQFFRVGIAGAGSGPECLAGLFKFIGLHQVAGLFDIGCGREGHQGKNGKYAHGGLRVFGAVWLGLGAAATGPAMAQAPEGMFRPIKEDMAAIGQLLFYDPILSGNQNISCGTCHNHDHFSADGVSLGIGEGGVGVGPKRVSHAGPDQIKKRIPRNAQALFNVGALQVFFHDGRLGASPDYGNGVNSPAEEFLPEGLDSLLAAQALFPMTSQFEMAGNPKENEVAGAIHDRIDMAWPILAKRVRINDTYRAMFAEAGVEEVSIADIGNALAAFMDAEWRSFDSPYDLGTMTAPQMRGADLFFGEAGCAECHSGPLFTDESFHAIGLPPFGPGRTRRFDPMPRDVGRMAESDALEDAYRFRTPSLRNVALTGPYGHNGAYPTLEGIIRHHADPLGSLDAWRPQMAQLPEVSWLQQADFLIQQDTREMARVRGAVDVQPRDLSDDQVMDLVAFMGALTGKDSIHGRLGKPDAVPSGLGVD